jgi:hypothetical protein
MDGGVGQMLDPRSMYGNRLSAIDSAEALDRGAIDPGFPGLSRRQV